MGGITQIIIQFLFGIFHLTIQLLGRPDSRPVARASSARRKAGLSEEMIAAVKTARIRCEGGGWPWRSGVILSGLGFGTFQCFCLA